MRNYVLILFLRQDRLLPFGQTGASQRSEAPNKHSRGRHRNPIPRHAAPFGNPAGRFRSKLIRIGAVNLDADYSG